MKQDCWNRPAELAHCNPSASTTSIAMLTTPDIIFGYSMRESGNLMLHLMCNVSLYSLIDWLA